MPRSLTYSRSWARSTMMAHVGVATVRFECQGETVKVNKAANGARVVSYLHYQKKLAHKPQAVRQLVPEFISELGEPYGSLSSSIVPGNLSSSSRRKRNWPPKTKRKSQE